MPHSLCPDDLAQLVIANSGHYAIAIFDLGGTIIGWNPAAERIFGWSAEEIIGQSGAVLFTASDRADGRHLLELQTALEHGIAMDERWHIKRDGTLFWASGEMTSLRREDAIVGFSKILRDRTRERDTEERLRIAQRAGGVGSFELFPTSGRILPSEQFCRLWGLPIQEELRVEDLLTMIHPDDRERVLTQKPMLSENALEYTEYRIQRADTGAIRWMARSGEFVHGEGSGPIRYLGVVYDITNKKRIEQNWSFLAQASAELGKLVDPRITLNRVAALAVPAFADWCAVDLLEQPTVLERVAVAHMDPKKVGLAYELHSRFPPDPNERHGVWQAVRTGQAQLTREVTDELISQMIQDPEYRTAVNKLGIKSYIIAPLLVRGNAIGAITFVNAESGCHFDDTDLSLAQDLARRAAVAIENADLYRSLREADLRKDEFLAMLAHELRNPLAPIRAAANLFELVNPNDVRLQRASEVIGRQVAHMAGLIDDLLDISRITRGLIKLNKEPLDVRRLMSDAIEQVDPVIQERRHSLFLHLPPSATMIIGDHKRLVQVLTNLLNNAAKYTPDGGKIVLKGEIQENQVVLSVSDNGIGMSSDIQAYAFELFTQAKGSLNRSSGGLGIGLAIVKNLVELHGGSVTCSSEGQGKGSEFVIRLPQWRSEIDQAVGETNAIDLSNSPRSLRIMVVDDNTDVEMLVMYLEASGHEVIVEQRALAVPERAKVERPDVLLLNLGLPDMDGYELARLLRKQPETADAVLIAITEYSNERGRSGSMAAGFDHHFVKPVDLRKLVQFLSLL